MDLATEGMQEKRVTSPYLLLFLALTAVVVHEVSGPPTGTRICPMNDGKGVSSMRKDQRLHLIDQ